MYQHQYNNGSVDKHTMDCYDYYYKMNYGINPATTPTPKSSSGSGSSKGTSGVDGVSSDNGSGLGLMAAAASAASGSSPQQRDTTWTKLFVGGLPYHTTDKSLRDHFKVYGEIDEAVVITDRQTGKSRGYGFVIMADRASAERACKEPNPIIDGRKANVNLAILGAKPRGTVAAASPFPFTAIRAGYPTSILASQYGIPANYMYHQPTGYGGAPLLSLQSAATSSPALAAAIASASANPMSQLYEHYQANGLGGVTNMGQQGNGGMQSFSVPTAAHFAAAAQAQAAFAAADPYGTSAAYLSAAGGHPHHTTSAQHHAAAYAAYLPQMTAGGMPGANTNNATGMPISQYAAGLAQETRMQ